MPRSIRTHIVGPTALALHLAACTGPADTPKSPAEPPAAAQSRAAVPEVAALAQSVAALRRATAPFHNIETAFASEFTTPITPCWYHGTLGAMGYHYADTHRIDGTVDMLAPEALLYEPLAGGTLALVAVEYIVRMDQWDGADPPTLFGRTFDEVAELGLYVLHVWAWRDNPAGLFAPWNPRVSCRHAAESEDRGHGH